MRERHRVDCCDMDGVRRIAVEDEKDSIALETRADDVVVVVAREAA